MRNPTTEVKINKSSGGERGGGQAQERVVNHISVVRCLDGDYFDAVGHEATSNRLMLKNVRFEKSISPDTSVFFQ